MSAGLYSGNNTVVLTNQACPVCRRMGEKKWVSTEALRVAAALGVSGVTGSEALDGSALGGSKCKLSTG
jgi:hypothetical protein